MKKLLAIALTATMTLSIVSCEDDEAGSEIKPGRTDINAVEVTSNIAKNTTWSGDSVYYLNTRVSVLSGVTLTIEPGCIVKGDAGTGTNATALLVAREATLNAKGTASAPIILTSSSDKIKTGQKTSPNLSEDINGLWGGLIVLGKAPISAQNENKEDVSEQQIEGIPTSDSNGLYGGSTADDNSGTITYVSVRHGGTNIGSGNEINGITLGGVGSKTIINNIEVVANQDDGIEWFGGSVNVSKAIVWNAGDDGVDTDQAWTGTLDGFVVITAGDEMMELDGPEGTVKGGHVMKNGTLLAQTDYNAEESEYDLACDGLIDLDNNNSNSSTGVELSNIAIFNPAGDIDEATCLDSEGGTNVCPMSSIEIVTVGLNKETYTVDEHNPKSASGVSGVAKATVGATLSDYSWSWSSTKLKKEGLE